MDIQERLKTYIRQSLKESGIDAAEVHIEHPADTAHGDWATNAALSYGKKHGKNARDLAERIAGYLQARDDADISAVEVAGPGFVNIRLSNAYFGRVLEAVLARPDTYGANARYSGKRVMIEYTDPNPFKEFHIGHLMTNVIGESLSRIIEFSGADIKRANYQGDVGVHVACAIWGIKKRGFDPADVRELGQAYAAGATAYKEDKNAKQEIDALNKAIYEGADEEVNTVYKKGRAASLQAFEKMYERLGTKFDYYFFESETGPLGRQIVNNNTGTVFKESEGAVIFPGEEYGLHTRVFINSAGLPTYEAKELGLADMKWRTWPAEESITVTGNEVAGYFKVVRAALEQIFPEIAKTMHHVPHGMLRLPSGKMSSRTGSVITAEALFSDVEKELEKMLSEVEVSYTNKITDGIVIGAVKHAVLRQTSGKDIIFDIEKSISFEGDSGPYLQYTHARACSVLQKAAAANLAPEARPVKEEMLPVARLVAQFPEVVLRALEEYEPHYITTYLGELAGAFNRFYAHERIIDATENAPERLALAGAVAAVLKNGLWLLGIQAPERM